MPSFSQYPELKLVKTMIAAESGSGKTGLLASLANSPRIKRLAIIDLDRGLQILDAYTRPEAKAKIHFVSLDPFDRMAADVMVRMAAHWKTPDEDLGPTAKWGPEDVFVIDTGTAAGQAIYTYVTETLNIKDDRAIFGEAQDRFEKFMAFCCYKLPCHFILLTHTKPDEKFGKTFPTTIGSALNRTIGRMFNNLWRIDLKAGGTTRTIRTAADHAMMLKCSNPLALKPDEDFDLAKIFDKLLGPSPK